MIAYKTYQERAYCSEAGYARIREVLGGCRWLYSRSLEERRNTYRACGKGMSKFAQIKHLTRLRQESQWWNDLSVQVARGVLMRVDCAFQSFFRRVKAGETPGYPRFQGKGRYRCIEFAEVTAGMVKGDEIRVKGLPRIRIHPTRELPDSHNLKSLRLVMRGRQLWVDLVYEIDVELLASSDQVVGIDMGVNERMTLSDGRTIERRVVDRDRERVLRRTVSRRRKGSAGRRKAVAALARELRRNVVRNRNKCHAITTELVRRYGVVVMEDLRVKNMTASGGTRKRGLNREILTQRWA